MTGTFLLSSCTAPKQFFTFTKVSISTGCGAIIFLKKALTRSLWQLFLLDPWPPNFCRVRRSAPVAPDFTAVSAYCWTSEAASLPHANLCKSKIARGDWSCISSSGSTTCFLFIPSQSWTSHGYRGSGCTFPAMHGYPAKPKDRNKTPGFPATTQQTVTKHMAFQPPPCNRQSQNTWLSSHHPTDSNKTKGLPATTKNTWLSSHHPTETKHMASSHHPATDSLKTAGFPATTQQTVTKPRAFQPPPKTHGFPATTQQKQNTWLPATTSRHSACFFAPRSHGWSFGKMPA